MELESKNIIKATDESSALARSACTAGYAAPRHIIWFSCGAASTIMAKFVLQSEPTAILVYCDTGSEHPDNKRFLSDVEKWLKVQIKILKSEKFENHFDVIDKTRWVNGIGGARCTVELKKRLRFDFQRADDIQYFGYTIEEKHRADRFTKNFPEVIARYPLINRGITKQECAGIIQKSGIEVPMMYKLGYNNNNCIGCVKGGAGYWNKIRKDFPEQFEKMATLERKIGATCIKGKYLDELSHNTGRHKDFEIKCDFVCETEADVATA